MKVFIDVAKEKLPLTQRNEFFDCSKFDFKGNNKCTHLEMCLQTLRSLFDYPLAIVALLSSTSNSAKMARMMLNLLISLRKGYPICKSRACKADENENLTLVN